MVHPILGVPEGLHYDRMTDTHEDDLGFYSVNRLEGKQGVFIKV